MLHLDKCAPSKKELGYVVILAELQRLQCQSASVTARPHTQRRSTSFVVTVRSGNYSRVQPLSSIHPSIHLPVRLSARPINCLDFDRDIHLFRTCHYLSSPSPISFSLHSNSTNNIYLSVFI